MNVQLGKKTVIGSIISAGTLAVAIGSILAIDDRVDEKISSQTSKFMDREVIAQTFEQTQQTIEASQNWYIYQQKNTINRQLRVIDRRKRELRATPDDLDLEFELLQELEDIKQRPQVSE